MKKPIKVVAMQKMKNIAMLSAIGLATVIFIFVWILSAANVKLASEQTALIGYANQFMDGSAYLTDEVRLYVATGKDSHEENYWNEINNLKNRDIGIAGMQEIGITEEEESKIIAMQNLSNELVPLESAAMDLEKEGKQAEAIDSVFGTSYEETIEEIHAIQDEFTDMITGRTQKEIDQASMIMAMLEVLLFIIMALIAVMQVVSEAITRKQLIDPLVVCSESIMEIAQGHLSTVIEISDDTVEMAHLSHAAQTILDTLSTVIVDIDMQLAKMGNGDFRTGGENTSCYVGDLAPVLESLTKLRGSLSESLSSVGETSSEVNTGAGHVSAGAMSLADASTEQAAFIQDLVATVDEITGKLQETSADLQQAKKANVDSYNALQHSRGQVKEMVAAMDEIEQKSKEIIEIIKAIDDITFQTNILSLNAAIEAARAGTAGKGFAVVADEVRNLATQSSDSSKSIAELIEETVRVVNKGSKIAAGTEESINVVAESAQRLVDIVDHIASGSSEQADAALTVKDGINRISDLVQTNAATSEESAAASEELFRHSQALENVVSRFKFR